MTDRWNWTPIEYLRLRVKKLTRGKKMYGFMTEQELEKVINQYQDAIFKLEGKEANKIF